MFNRKYFLFLIIWCIACGNDTDNNPADLPVTIKYTASNEDFPNPERGFYRYSETSGGNYRPLSVSQLKNYRNPHKSSSATYTVVSTLVFRYYILDTFTNSALTEGFLNNVKGDFAIAREAGAKLIPRFTYTVSANGGDCQEGFICPPYGDAPKSVVLQHIEQLKPLFQENEDVIACVQMGFIGTWGENYYTDFFGDASSNGQGKLLDPNWQDRIDVLAALLDAVPEKIMVQVRYPQIKQRLLYGINAPVSSAPLLESEAFTATDKARIGFHNDCLLASTDDFGTYEDYGNSSTPRTTANTTLRKYFAEDSKFVVVGGETCSDGFSPQNDCEPTGKAEKELRDLHYSYLNTDYNNQVNNDWEAGGCMESIKRNLGYRFVLKDATFELTESILHATINMENVGYASPFNERSAVLVLRNTADQTTHRLPIDTDVRKWFSGNMTIEGSFSLESIEAGEYELLLHLPDRHESILNRPEYSIRLANDSVWEVETGYNKLLHTIHIH